MQIEHKGGAAMALVTLTARVDEKDKASFDAFCSNVGLNVSTAVNLFVKAVLRENRIPIRSFLMRIWLM